MVSLAFLLDPRQEASLPENKPSTHVNWEELECHSKPPIPYPLVWRQTRLPELMKAFERIRELCGFPIEINSAYRTPEYNVAIGGARTSQHCEGRALDLKPIPFTKKNLLHLEAAAYKARTEGLLRGVGYYKTFVHIDTRPGRNATWGGSRSSNAV